MNNPILQVYNQFRQNPMAVLQKKYNIPGNMNNPNDIIQHLLNTGQVSQAQVNQAMQIKNDPRFKGMFDK